MRLGLPQGPAARPQKQACAAYPPGQRRRPHNRVRQRPWQRQGAAAESPQLPQAGQRRGQVGWQSGAVVQAQLGETCAWGLDKGGVFGAISLPCSTQQAAPTCEAPQRLDGWGWQRAGGLQLEAAQHFGPQRVQEVGKLPAAGGSVPLDLAAVQHGKALHQVALPPQQAVVSGKPVGGTLPQIRPPVAGKQAEIKLPGFPAARRAQQQVAPAPAHGARRSPARGCVGGWDGARLGERRSPQAAVELLGDRVPGPWTGLLARS